MDDSPERIGRRPIPSIDADVRRVEASREGEPAHARNGASGTHPRADDELNASLRGFLIRAIKLLHDDAGCIQLVHPVTGELTLRVQLGVAGLTNDHLLDLAHIAFASGRRYIIEDVTHSPLLPDNHVRTLLMAAGIRSMQCTPLSLHPGTSVGVLSTCSSQPRTPLREDLAMLDVLASSAAELVESMQAKERRRVRRERFRQVRTLAGVAAFEWSPVSGEIQGDESFSALCGLAAGERITLGSFAERVHSEDRVSFVRGLELALQVRQGHCKPVSFRFCADATQEPRHFVLQGYTSFRGEEVDCFVGALVEQQTADVRIRELAPAEAVTDASRSAKAKSSDKTPAALASVIANLLAADRIAHQPRPSRAERIALQIVLERAIEIARPWINVASHHLVLDWPARPVVIDVDASRMADAFAELLVNAAAYTAREGSIALAVRELVRHVEVRIEDNGSGIPAEELPHIFSMYAQSGREREHASGRLGLGLGIVRATIESQNGTVRAFSSGIGQGSAFTVTLPVVSRLLLANDPEWHSALPTASGDLRRRMLIAGSGVGSAHSLITPLRRIGHEIRVGSDLQACTDLAREYRPHVVLINMELREPGFKLARRIRSLALTPDPVIVPVVRPEERLRERPDVPHVVDLSAYYLSELNESCADYLHGEIEIATAHIRHAAECTHDDARTRAREAAHRACGTVEVLLGVVALPAERREQIAQRVSIMRAYLVQLSCT